MMTHQRRLFWMAFAAGLPGSALGLGMLWWGGYSAKVQWTVGLLVVGLWLGFAMAVRERTVMPLQTLANLLEALREGDYSIRARRADPEDALGEVMIEVNALGELLRRQRFHAVDAAALLRKVNEEIDVGIFTFDGTGVLRLVNRAGQRMMARPAERLVGCAASQLGLEECLGGEPEQTFERSFPGQTGRWQSRRSIFREGGKPHQLLVLTDLSKALRDEERQAWQRLIRVLGHELRNSLAPIKSTASTLSDLLRRASPPEGWREDAQRGLSIVAERCESLNRFVTAYSRLARLPAPTLRPTPIGPLIRRVAALESRLAVAVEEGPEIVLAADPDQLEQLLINLVQNAADAALEVGGDVHLRWRDRHGFFELRVLDEGPGLPSSANLFVPFFTTKEGGTGVGLVLGRQIAEAHGGSLSLSNRRHRGCEALLRLPLPRD